MRKLAPSDVSAMHDACKKYIKSSITLAKKKKQKVIVLTHHKPYCDPESQNYGYESDCSELFGDPVVLWAYGHTHIRDSKMINGTLLYSNPKGYFRQKTGFKPTQVMTV
jgi:predicted phosphodiesterase